MGRGRAHIRQKSAGILIGIGIAIPIEEIIEYIVAAGELRHQPLNHQSVEHMLWNIASHRTPSPALPNANPSWAVSFQ